MDETPRLLGGSTGASSIVLPVIKVLDKWTNAAIGAKECMVVLQPQGSVPAAIAMLEYGIRYIIFMPCGTVHSDLFMDLWGTISADDLDREDNSVHGLYRRAALKAPLQLKFNETSYSFVNDSRMI